MNRRLIALISAGFFAALGTSCTDSSNSGSGPGNYGDSVQKPSHPWGYPKYSEYQDGKHAGQNFYQLDSTCKQSLAFKSCAFVDATISDNPTNNPTGASSSMTGGLEQCTDSISQDAPSYCMPVELCNPNLQNTAWAPGQASADNLAWQLFIAVNWPANPEEPGYPDVNAELGAVDESGGQHAQAVWLDYPNVDELFGVSSPCEGPTLEMNSKVSRAFLSKNPPPGALGGSVESDGNLLVDQAGNLVYFDIRVNRTIWEFVVNQNDYWKPGESLAGISQWPFRDYSERGVIKVTGSFPLAMVNDPDSDELGDIGSMELKASWKQLSSDEITQANYYTREFSLYEPDAPEGEQCKSRTMGLTGMHVVYMPAQFGNPDWVWATFEHKKNVPTATINDDELDFSFHAASCTPVKTEQECAEYAINVDSPDDFRCCPNLPLYNRNSNISTDTGLVPNQLTRVVNPTVSSILPTRCDEHHRDAITTHFGADNVWGNYFLVSTQWPLRQSSTNNPPYLSNAKVNFPCKLRNTTLESFLVGSTQSGLSGCEADLDVNHCRSCNGDCMDTAVAATQVCTDSSSSSEQFLKADCMSCHSAHSQQNSSFIFSHRPCCIERNGALPSACGRIQNQSMCESDQTCSWVSSDPICSGTI